MMRTNDKPPFSALLEGYLHFNGAFVDKPLTMIIIIVITVKSMTKTTLIT